MKSPGLSHHLQSRVPRMGESFLKTRDFRKRFLAPLSAPLCLQRLCRRLLAGTSPAFGRQEGCRTRGSRLKATVIRIIQILSY